MVRSFQLARPCPLVPTLLVGDNVTTQCAVHNAQMDSTPSWPLFLGTPTLDEIAEMERGTRHFLHSKFKYRRNNSRWFCSTLTSDVTPHMSHHKSKLQLWTCERMDREVRQFVGGCVSPFLKILPIGRTRTSPPPLACSVKIHNPRQWLLTPYKTTPFTYLDRLVADGMRRKSSKETEVGSRGFMEYLGERSQWYSWIFPSAE